MYQRRNESPDFVGLEALKKRHENQLSHFERWAQQRDWNSFHMSHYDWWMFPYGCHSGAFGASCAIYDYEAEQLKLDKEFIRRFLRGVELLMLSWAGTCMADVRCRIPILTSAGRIGRSAYINVPSP